MKLEITADKVKEAAAKCPQAEATLKTLFPEVFGDDINLVSERGIGERCLFSKGGTAGTSMIAVRDNKQFYLSNDFDWSLVDYQTFKTLVPTKK